MIDPETLLSGPRGRRLLLEFALASERTEDTDYNRHRLMPAVSYAAYELDPGRGRSRVMGTIGHGDLTIPSVSPPDVADALLAVTPVDVTEELLRDSLAMSVITARYWQEPEGEDVLTATKVVRDALRPFAEHVTHSPLTNWWTSGVDLDDQWTVNWGENTTVRPVGDPALALETWREEALAVESRAAHERPSDPTANISGEWWSIPSPMTLLNSSRSLFDDSPAGLWWTEDAGRQNASTRQVYIPASARVLEITDAGVWVDLSRQYPLEVTASKRHDWYRTTGRSGRWVMPDWSQVAREFDGVHLTVSAWLAAAGTILPIADDTASVIAGWSPDETWWFIAPSSLGEISNWRFESTFEDQGWIRM